MTSTWAAVALRVAAVTGSSVALVCSGFVALNEVLLHGFAHHCSDGHSEFDPAVCGITWRPGLPYVLAGLVSLLVLVLSVGERGFTRVVLVTSGLVSVALAAYLLVVTTWRPVNPLHPEPAGPQVVLLLAGLAGTIAGLWPWPPRLVGARGPAGR